MMIMPIYTGRGGDPKFFAGFLTCLVLLLFGVLVGGGYFYYFGKIEQDFNCNSSEKCTVSTYIYKGFAERVYSADVYNVPLDSVQIVKESEHAKASVILKKINATDEK